MYIYSNCYTIKQNGLTALHLAAKEGHNEVVVQLLKRGINIDAITSVSPPSSI